MSEYTEALRAELDELLAEHPRTSPGEVVAMMRARHPELVATEANRLVDASMAREVKAMTKQTVDGDDEQMELFGFPRVLTVPTGDTFDLVRTDKALWSDLVGQRGLMSLNVVNAQRKLDTFDASMEQLRPLMEGTSLTVLDAIAALGARPVSDG